MNVALAEKRVGQVRYTPSVEIAMGVDHEDHGAYRARRIQFVFKVSRYCNLRCSYCYEFDHLADRTRTSIADIKRVFESISGFRPYGGPLPDCATVSFVWHGGEPFMIPLEYYENVVSLQKELIEPHLTYSNGVQTNLTIITEPILETLRSQKLFQDIGFSFDVYGDQRVDVRGRSSTDRVLGNIERLIGNDIQAGAIVVLSKSTLPHVERIFGFYESLGINFRLLPYSAEVNAKQTIQNGLTHEEIVEGLCRLFNIWCFSASPINIEPVQTYIDASINHMQGVRDRKFSKWQDEAIFLVDPDGSISGYESYNGQERYGNLVDQSFDEIIHSPARKAMTDRSEQLVRRFCGECKFYGSCSGQYVAEIQPLEKIMLEQRGCYVAEVIEHIVTTFERAGLVPQLS